MITRIIRKIVKYRILIMVYLSGATDWNWNTKKKCFVPASIYLRWNGRLLLIFGTAFPFLMSAFLLSKVPNGEYMESTENFVIFILGWAEMFIVTATLLANFRMKRYWRDIMYILNEISRYSDYIEELMRRRNTHLNREDQKYLVRAGMLVGLTAVLTSFVPFAFGACVCVRVEPTHAMLEDWLEVNISLKPKFILFIFFLAWIVSNAGSVAFSAVTFVYESIILARILVSGLTPQSVSKMVQPGSSSYKVLRYELNSRYFGILDEMTAIQIFRTQQLFNTILNDICGSVLIAFHHVACMLAFLGGALTVLQATDQVLDGGLLMLAVMLIAVFVPLALEYVESKEISDLCEKSDGFVRRCAKLTDRRSMLHKFSRSCRNLKVHLGYPFFNVGKDTFTQFWAQGLGFLVGMLAV
ncbi:unnamed protein product [Orchesella dallaii]|uniref:Odorant receptor n=1 Tax=Orchesella dallaii TaxID=48710 RepID=A0ABP1SAP0_9HEXA